MERNDVLDAILVLASNSEPEALGELTVSLTQEPLYEAALDHFGGWDIALAAAIGRALTTTPRREQTRLNLQTLEDTEEREPHLDAMRALFCGTSRGYLIRVPADHLAMSAEVGVAQTVAEWPEGVGVPLWFADIGDANSVASLSDDGRVFGWDASIVPDAACGIVERRLADRDSVAGWVCAHSRSLFHQEGSFVHLTAAGKLKVSLTTAFKRLVAREGVQAFLLDDDDEPVSAHLCRKDDFVLIASSNGYAINFPIAEVRPMGLKATGVKAMKLGQGATVVGSVLASRCEQIALVTKEGFGKRVPVREFRPQSRAGSGLVALKLAGRDTLVATAPCSANSDLLMATSSGNTLRVPASVFPLMSRPARGNRVIELRDGEEVASVASLLPAEY